jgi:hypothetical protein
MPEKDGVLLWRCQVPNTGKERMGMAACALFLLAQAGWWLTVALG